MKTPWDTFFESRVTKIFSEKKNVIDIGGGLRLVKDRGNRYDPKREWIRPLLKDVDYRVLDAVSDYNPDIVGDIHNLPFEDNTQDAIICIAVLEHVENPIKAWGEINRALKPGGYCFIYVPFLYYYHADQGYYGDFWRFTEDSIRHLSKEFSKIEICPVRGALQTWIKLSPIGRVEFLNFLWIWIDNITGKSKSRQVSGYNVFLVK